MGPQSRYNVEKMLEKAHTKKEIQHDEYCAGRCPKCDSDNLQYYTPQEDGDQLSYKADCKNCGLEFHEYYHVKYEHSYGVEYINNK